jgi:hypothetical protein
MISTDLCQAKRRSSNTALFATGDAKTENSNI